MTLTPSFGFRRISRRFVDFLAEKRRKNRKPTTYNLLLVLNSNEIKSKGFVKKMARKLYLIPQL